MNLFVCVKKVGVSDWGRRGVLCVKVGELSEIVLKEGGIEKRVVEAKMLKREGKLG